MENEVVEVVDNTPDVTAPAGSDNFDMSSALDEISDGLKLTDTSAENEEGEEKPAAAPSKDQQPVAPKTASEQSAPAAEADPNAPKAPGTWKPDVAAKWATVDPDVKAEILRRESDVGRYVQQVGPFAKVGEIAENFFQSQRDLAQSQNINVWDKTAELWQHYRGFVSAHPQDRVGLLLKFAQDNGVDLSGQVEGFTAPDARVQQLQAHIQRLEADNRATKAEFVKLGDGLHQERTAKLSSDIDAFQNSGEAPYFTEVLEDMKFLVSSGRCKDIKSAYSEAVRLNPVTSLKVQQEAAAKASAKALEEAKARARKATGASSVNVRSSGGRGAQSPVLDIDQTLEATMKDIEARN